MISPATINEKLVLEMWESGKTATEISQALGVTRNVVAGKLHRMREQRRIGYKNIQRRVAALKGNETKQRAKMLRVMESKLAMEEERKTVDVAEVVKPLITESIRKPTGKPVGLMGLGPLSCRYVVSGVMAKDFLFCNEVKKPGSSYCAEHHAICCIPNYTMRQKEKLDDITTKSNHPSNNPKRQSYGSSAN